MEEMTAEQLMEELATEDGKWNAFEQVLGEMTPIYHEDGEWLDIVRANISHAKPGGEEIGIQPDLPREMEPEVSGPDVLRLLDDLCAHEVEHVNASPLEAKQEFVKQYPNFGKLAGQVYNIFEDEYIDMRRKRRFYGMRSKLAYYVWLHMNTPSRAPPVDEVEENEGLANALMCGLLQVALAGYMNGDPSDEVKDAMARMEPLLNEVREEDDPHRREVLSHAAIQVLLRYIPDPDEFDGDEMEDRKRATGGDPRELDDESPETPDGEPRVEMDDDMKEAVEEMLEELMEDDEVPDPVPDGEPKVVEDPSELEDEMEAELDADEFEMDGPEAGESEDGDETGDGGAEMDGMAESGAGGDEDGRESDVDDETIDPLGDDAGGGPGESSGEGESDGDGDGFDRDIEALLDEYGVENLKVK